MSGTDEMWLRAYNGTWSSGPQANITDSPVAAAGTPNNGAMSGAGALTINIGTTLELDSPYEGTVTFAADTGTLRLDNSWSFAGTVAGMSGQDTIDFADIDSTKVQRPTYSGTASGEILTVTDGSHTANIALLGNYIASTFVTSSDGHGGTNVVDPSATETSQTSLLVQPHHA